MFGGCGCTVPTDDQRVRVFQRRARSQVGRCRPDCPEPHSAERAIGDTQVVCRPGSDRWLLRTSVRVTESSALEYPGNAGRTGLDSAVKLVR
jgi:hypothetical protein